METASAFASALGIADGEVARGMDAMLDVLDGSLPAGTKFRSVPVLAEILVHHALRVSGKPFNRDTFARASPVGYMPMASRKWLLRYVQYLGPRERLALIAAPGTDPVLYLDPLAGKAPAVYINAMAILHGCKAMLGRLSPRFRAAVAAIAALQGLAITRPRDVEGWSMTKLMVEGGLPSISSVYNAAKRVPFGDLVRFVAPVPAAGAGEGADGAAGATA